MTWSVERETHTARRFGWTSLLAWATLGVGLELAHGFKLAPYLDDEVARLLLRLAHAHGVGLSLLLLVHATSGAPMFAGRPDSGSLVGRLLRVALVCLPGGFLLGVIDHGESDPGLGIALAPLGAGALLWALSMLTLAARTPR